VRSSAPRVAKNTLAQVVARALEGGTNFAVTILLARKLGAGSLGAFAFLITYASIFIFLGTFGLNLLMARDVARRRHEARRYLSNALGMSLPLVALTFAVEVGIILLVSDEPLVRNGIYVAAAFAVFHSWELLFVGVFYALERMELEAIGIFIEKALLLAAVFALVLKGVGVIAVLAAFAGAKALLVIFYLVLATRLVGFPRPAADLSLWRNLAARSWSFSVNLLVTSVYFQIYVVLLGMLASDQAAGYFRAGSILALSLPMFAAGLNNALLPLMARAHPQRRDSFMFGLERSFTALVLAGMPIAVGLIVLAAPVVRLLYGARFGPAVIVFQLLAVTVPLNFVANTLGIGLTAADRQPQRTYAASIGAALNVILNVGLIFAFMRAGPATGAAVAAIITDIVILALTDMYLRRAGYRLPVLSLSVRPTLAAAIMGLALWWIRGMSLSLTVPVGIAIYCGAAYAVGAVRRSDLVWLRQAFSGALVRAQGAAGRDESGARPDSQ
jgi:O-antigen/teichoic acid export membrane protein